MEITIYMVIGLFFSPIAGAMAFLIFYNEYLHHYPNKKQPLKIALEAAFITFILFFILSIIGGFFIYKIQ